MHHRCLALEQKTLVSSFADTNVFCSFILWQDSYLFNDLAFTSSAFAFSVNSSFFIGSSSNSAMS